MDSFTLEQRGAEILEKLDAGYVLPPPEALRNDGTRRTPEKRALLRRLQALADEQRRPVPFPAEY